MDFVEMEGLTNSVCCFSKPPLQLNKTSYKQNNILLCFMVLHYLIIVPQLLKSVVERGKWTRLFMEAQKLYVAGDVNSALMMYLLLSELGFEVAQSNAAYILDQGKIAILAL